MKRLFSISSDSEYVRIIVKKRPLYSIKNILLLLFLICSVYAPWYTNAMWCFGVGNKPALGTFLNTLYFFGAVLLYAAFADKWWNIPCGIYMLLMSIGAAAGIAAPASGLYDGFNLLVMASTWGLYYIAPYSKVWGVISLVLTLIFSIAVLWLVLRRYRRKEKT